MIKTPHCMQVYSADSSCMVSTRSREELAAVDLFVAITTDRQRLLRSDMHLWGLLQHHYTPRRHVGIVCFIDSPSLLLKEHEVKQCTSPAAAAKPN